MDGRRQPQTDVADLGFATPDTEFGAGCVSGLREVLAEQNVTSPLVVTDDGVEAAGVLDTALASLETDPDIYYATTEPGTDDFDDVPTTDVDGVIAIGGGSCLDTAKIVTTLLAHGGTPTDYLGVDHVPGRITPLIAVPTTSGTGSQATQTAVITYDGVKRGISDEWLRPDVAVVDPELTYDLPEAVTVRAGFDAFVHALESLTAREYHDVPARPINYQGANPVSRPLSRQALYLIHGAIESAADGDKQARRQLSLGAHLAGTAFSNAGLGAVHALASSVGGMTGRPHGECLAASVSVGLTYNLPERRQQYAAVAHELGVAEDDASTETAALALLEECERLRMALGLPDGLTAVGLGPDDAEPLVENTLLQTRRLKTNPREVTAQLRDPVRAALMGEQ